jgi:hypothetical protein
MPICTYITDSEKEQWTSVSDKEINRLLQEVRQIDPKCLIQERECTIKRMFRRPKTLRLYTVYNYVSYGEAQIINFCQEHTWSLNTAVSRSYVITYLYGILSGIHVATHKTTTP